MHLISFDIEIYVCHNFKERQVTTLQNIFKLEFTLDSDETGLSRAPIIAASVLIYLSYIFMQYIKKSPLIQL